MKILFIKEKVIQGFDFFFNFNSILMFKYLFCSLNNYLMIGRSTVVDKF